MLPPSNYVQRFVRASLEPHQNCRYDPPTPRLLSKTVITTQLGLSWLIVLASLCCLAWLRRGFWAKLGSKVKKKTKAEESMLPPRPQTVYKKAARSLSGHHSPVIMAFVACVTRPQTVWRHAHVRDCQSSRRVFPPFSFKTTDNCWRFFLHSWHVWLFFLLILVESAQ